MALQQALDSFEADWHNRCGDFIGDGLGFAGRVADVKVFNRPLSSDEIVRLAAQPDPLNGHTPPGGGGEGESAGELRAEPWNVLVPSPMQAPECIDQLAT